jgi:archaea-specific DNA-binding protein
MAPTNLVYILYFAVLRADEPPGATPDRAIIRRKPDGNTMPGETKTVIVGQSKPLLNYVTACITMFNSGADHVILRSRGEAINMAVEVVQVLKKRFVSQVEISKIQIDGEDVVSRDGRQLSLSVLEIELSMPKTNPA